jgi:hypothetical protein
MTDSFVPIGSIVTSLARLCALDYIAFQLRWSKLRRMLVCAGDPLPPRLQRGFVEREGAAGLLADRVGVKQMRSAGTVTDNDFQEYRNGVVILLIGGLALDAVPTADWLKPSRYLRQYREDVDVGAVSREPPCRWGAEGNSPRGFCGRPTKEA